MTRDTISQQINSWDFDGCIREYTGYSVEIAKSLTDIASQLAVTPLSGFNVGAVAVGASGHLYLGANIEFSGVPISSSLHAEQSAVLNAWLHGESEIQAIVVSAAPCGHCRQFLYELSNADNIFIIFNEHRKLLADLLPFNFSLQKAQGESLLNSRKRALEAVRSGLDKIETLATAAACRSYAPYTQSYEGFALECTDGRDFTGRVAQSAAFNPTVPAVICALNQRNLSSSRQLPITRCSHARIATDQTSQSGLTTSIIKGISEVNIQTVLMEPE